MTAPCEVCGKSTEPSDGPPRKLCTTHATKATYQARWLANHPTYRDGYNAARRVHHEPRTCAGCELEFIPRRSDARYCCTACGAATRTYGYPTAESREAHHRMHPAPVPEMIRGGPDPERHADGERWYVCLHESGHALVGLCVGLPPLVVSVSPGATYHGVSILEPRPVGETPGDPTVWYDPALTMRLRDRLEAEIAMTLAGPIAGELAYLTGWQPPEVSADEEAAATAAGHIGRVGPAHRERLEAASRKSDLATDAQAARRDALVLVHDDEEAAAYVLAYCRVMARDTIHALAESVHALAERLYRTGTVSGEEIAAMFPTLGRRTEGVPG